ncbi:MAG: putative metal-dependent hydrolase [Ignavibacteria bacterium]|nr:putative metal-dependent hydrolase [Ignavibacteria bacterium]
MITKPKTLSSIEHIRSLPSKLEKAIEGLSDSQLDTPYREGGWTVRQVVHHLVDSHANALIRIKLVLTEDNPILKPYLQDAWAELPDCKEMDVIHSIHILRGLHTKWVYLLERLTDEDLSRKGNHLDDGQVTLETLIDGYARHGINHVYQINSLREKMGWI